MGSRAVWVRPRAAFSEGYEGEGCQGDRDGGSVQPGAWFSRFTLLRLMAGLFLSVLTLFVQNFPFAPPFFRVISPRCVLSLLQWSTAWLISLLFHV